MWMLRVQAAIFALFLSLAGVTGAAASSEKLHNEIGEGCAVAQAEYDRSFGDFQRQYLPYGQQDGISVKARHSLSKIRERHATAARIILDAAKACGSGANALSAEVVADAAWALVIFQRAIRAHEVDDKRVQAALLSLGDGGGMCISSGCYTMLSHMALRDAERRKDDTPDEAIGFAKDALALAIQGPPSLDEAEAWMALAMAQPGIDGRPNPRHVRSAYAALRSAQRREALSVDDGAAQRFRHRAIPIFQYMADVEYYDPAGGPERRLLALGEAERLAQIEANLSDACDPPGAPMNAEALEPGETFVYPVVGAYETYILVGTKKGGWRAHPVDAPGVVLAQSADDLLAKFSIVVKKNYSIAKHEEDTGDDWGEMQARDLYATLIRPVRPYFSVGRSGEVPILIFFPDPVIRNIPWAVLLREEEGRKTYLVQDYAVATAPSFAFLARPKRSSGRGGMLIAGAKSTKGERFEAFLTELSTHGRMRKYVQFAEATGENFNSSGLRRDFQKGGFTSLLLATHAAYNGGRPQIATSDPKDPINVSELSDDLTANRLRQKPLDLLVLIACEGAKGGAGGVGIADTAVQSGAVTTFGALVEIPAPIVPYYLLSAHDNYTPPSKTNKNIGGWPGMKTASDFRPLRFLDHYFEGAGAARSLRLSQIADFSNEERLPGDELVPEEMLRLQHPARWGAYVVVGWWR